MMTSLIVDAHVHLHACYNEANFLAAAHANLACHGEGFPTLLLAEMAGASVFGRWRSGDAAWPVAPTREPSSLILGDKLLVIAGRQIVTAEKIEVLAQLTAHSFPDGEPLDATIERVIDSGGLAVLPWGVGKWLGTRGRRIAKAAARFPVLLGDNAGRPVGWPTPGLFANRIVLPGSDPLALPSQERIVGTFAFRLSDPVDLDTPAAQIGKRLRALTESPPVCGRRVGIFTFLRQQLGLRMNR